MAFFERSDERDPLITCNICKVKCAERSITQHKFKCADRHKGKFDNGQLVRCKYDSGHIVESENMKLHLEFCVKRQNDLRAEYQRAIADHQNPVANVQLARDSEDAEKAVETIVDDQTTDWGVEADRKPYRNPNQMRFK